MPKSPVSKKVKISLGPVVVDDDDTPDRIALLLWGPPGDGKTMFAATAPGKKLWLSFGDDEHKSVRGRKDVMVANVAKLSVDELFQQAQNDNPFGLDQVLRDNTEIETVVCDSLTALAFRALQKAIKEGVGASSRFTPSIMTPGISAYGARNGIVLEAVTGLLRVTAKHGVHIILTAHEADPTYVKGKEQEGIIDYIGVMLGGQLVNNMSLRLGEIWHLRQGKTGSKERVLSIRPNANRKPMKTRMFRGDQNASFTLTYNAFKPDDGQMTIAGFWDKWLKQDGKHLDVPKGGNDGG